MLMSRDGIAAILRFEFEFGFGFGGRMCPRIARRRANTPECTMVVISFELTMYLVLDFRFFANRRRGVNVNSDGRS